MAAKALINKKTQEEETSSSVMPARLLELQKKIQDENYINFAVDRIAAVMSRHLTNTDVTSIS